MSYRTIACLDDLTRSGIGPDCEFIYDLVRVPVWHSTGIDIAKSPRDGQRHNLAPTLRVDDFLALCGLPQRHWSTLRHRVPPEASLLLAGALPEQALVIGADMPPWLVALLDAAGRDWLSLSLSPLSIGAERWFQARSHSPALRAVLQGAAVTEAEMLTHALLHAAAVRHRRRLAAPAEDWNGLLVWLGQAQEDPALVDTQGRFARVEPHAESLRAAAEGRRLVHWSPDPGGAWAEAERRVLAGLCGQDVPACQAPLSELLAGDEDVAFIGLNAPALQAAAWYGKPATQLLEPADDGAVLLPVATVLSEPLWAALLTGQPARDGAVTLPPAADLLQRLLDPPPAAPAPAPAVAPEPGLRQALEIERQRVDDLRLEVEGLKEALRVVLRQSALAANLARAPGTAHA